MNSIPVILYGLGPIGRGVGRALAEEPRLQAIGAVDIDTAIIGRRLSEVCDADLPSLTVVSSLDETDAKPGAVLLQATVSKLKAARPQLLNAIARGYHVVSTSEELVWPWDDYPQLAAEIDQAAREAGVTVLGIGVNPGFVMDTLPVLLSRAAGAIEAIHVSRIVDLTERRLQLQRKNGLGQNVDRVQKLLDAEAIGHVGLTTSLQMLAAGLGWDLDVIDIESKALTAETPTSTGQIDIHTGQCVGIRQRAQGFIRGVPRIILKLVMEANVEGGTRDEVIIDGDQCLRLRLDGLHGDLATAALIVNQARYVQAMPAGLQTMLSAPLASRT
ncbi:MAG TPA: dihydrodipicolinate reductase [Caldilineae bacterium]|nr:dihydrodipicolinate reductase [Caldilineae bacterium]